MSLECHTLPKATIALFLFAACVTACASDEHSKNGEPQAVAVRLCVDQPYFIVAGARTSVPVEPKIETSLARVVRKVKAHGLGTITIDSMCKLTHEGLAVYCEEFERGGIHVASVEVPLGRPPGHQILSCDAR